MESRKQLSDTILKESILSATMPVQTRSMTMKLIHDKNMKDLEKPTCFGCADVVDTESLRVYLLPCGWSCTACMQKHEDTCSVCFPLDDSDWESETDSE